MGVHWCEALHTLQYKLVPASPTNSTGKTVNRTTGDPERGVHNRREAIMQYPTLSNSRSQPTDTTTTNTTTTPPPPPPPPPHHNHHNNNTEATNKPVRAEGQASPNCEICYLGGKTILEN
jgi:hypothetical protein